MLNRIVLMNPKILSPDHFYDVFRHGCLNAKTKWSSEWKGHV
jgi:hypothetical protein